MSKIIFWFSSFLAFFSLTKSFAQNEFENTFYTNIVKTFNCQVFTLELPDTDTVEAVVVYKYSLSNLTFEKTSTTPQGLLRGIAFIEVIFRDEIGIIRKIISRVDTLFKEEVFTTNSYSFDKVGSLSARIPKGNYQVELNLYDKKIIKQKSIKLDLKALKTVFFSIPTIIFASKQAPNFYTIEPTNFLDFKKKNKTILFGIKPKIKPNKFNFIVKSSSDKTDRLIWSKEVKYQGTLRELQQKKFEFDSSNLKLNLVDDSISNVCFYELSIPEYFAYPQKYFCYLIDDDNKQDTLTFDFQIRWEETPLSLRNIQYAIDLMYYILTDKEFKTLMDKKKSELSTSFFETWRKFDTDTTTLFNEAMEEYYNRVDFAYFNFQTIDEPDGAKTDRGKVYILFGKPSSISRELEKNGKVNEVWNYSTMHQSFTFVSQDGKLILKKISKY
ncbi:MAG: GWxTD domain-containing protein [Candidatus Kapaibacteriales bacterium]